MQLDPIKVKAVRKQPPGTGAQAPADKKGNAGKKTKTAGPAGVRQAPRSLTCSTVVLPWSPSFW